MFVNVNDLYLSSTNLKHIVIAIEECSELIKALTKSVRYGVTKNGKI